MPTMAFACWHEGSIHIRSVCPGWHPRCSSWNLAHLSLWQSQMHGYHDLSGGHRRTTDEVSLCTGHACIPQVHISQMHSNRLGLGELVLRSPKTMKRETCPSVPLLVPMRTSRSLSLSLLKLSLHLLHCTVSLYPADEQCDFSVEVSVMSGWILPN